MRFTFSRKEAMRKSSAMESTLPTSRDFMLIPRSLLLPKDVEPLAKRRPRASAVWICAVLISSRSVMGTSACASRLPGSEDAFSVRWLIILWYSNTLNTLLFILTSVCLYFCFVYLFCCSSMIQQMCSP